MSHFLFTESIFQHKMAFLFGMRVHNFTSFFFLFDKKFHVTQDSLKNSVDKDDLELLILLLLPP